MTIKKQIKDILLNNFHSVYCDTCVHKNHDNICDYCHRKSMDWSLSSEAAEEIAEEIINVMTNT